MIPTHEQVNGGEEYLGFARHKLAFLEMARREADSPSMTWGPVDMGNATVFVKSADDGNLIRIDGGKGSFLFHPRTGPIANGFFQKNGLYERHRFVNGPGFTASGEPLPVGSYAYPLVDDDHGTQGIGKEADVWSLDTAPPENYGNIDWKGPNTGPEGSARILTWKGPPSRHFPLASTLSIPGLTIDYETLADIDYYTPFSSLIYEDGDIYATVPALGVSPSCVLGAAVNNGRLVTVLGTNYRGVTNPAGGTGGFYFELWTRDGGGSDLYEPDNNPGGWKRIAYTVGSRCSVPWFFNASGSEAQTIIGEIRHKVTYTYQQGTEGGTFSMIGCCTGTISGANSVVNTTFQTYEGVLPEIGIFVDPDNAPSLLDSSSGADSSLSCSSAKSRACIVMIDYKGDEEVLAIATLQQNESSGVANHSEVDYDLIRTYLYHEPVPPPLVLYGQEDLYADVGDVFTASGGCIPYSFTFTRGTISNDGEILSVNCTPGSIAVGTITVTDSIGNSASIKVYLRAGIWVNVGDLREYNYSHSGGGAVPQHVTLGDYPVCGELFSMTNDAGMNGTRTTYGGIWSTAQIAHYTNGELDGYVAYSPVDGHMPVNPDGWDGCYDDECEFPVVHALCRAQDQELRCP